MKFPLLRVKNLSKEFQVKKRTLYAVNNLSFDIFAGETLGLVGESGCGKSTVAKLLLRLLEVTQGEVWFDAHNILRYEREELHKMRKKMQIIFQDPYASLNPRMTAEEIIREPLDIHNILNRKKRKDRIIELLELVGLNKKHLSSFPHEFSGGQRQRICIARALASNPQFIICDEPIAALDVSIQAQIVNLLKRLQKERGLTYLFISHDLSMVKYLSNRVAVMYLGHLVELAPSQNLYAEPLHPYTEGLLTSIPIPDPTVEKKKKRLFLQGEPPSPLSPPKGCPFCTRCVKALPICKEVPPKWKQVNPDHFTACHLYS